MLELGSAPGGWSQVVSEKLGPQSKFLAVDLIDMQELERCTFLKGNFMDPKVLDFARNYFGYIFWRKKS